MHWVLVEIKDEAVEGFVRKAGKRVLGVWEHPKEFCDCGNPNTFKFWYYNKDVNRPLCRTCEKVHPTYINNIGPRVRWTFGRNLIGRFFPDRKDFD